MRMRCSDNATSAFIAVICRRRARFHRPRRRRPRRRDTRALVRCASVGMRKMLIWYGLHYNREGNVSIS